MNLDTLTPLPPIFDLGDCRLRPLRPTDAPAWFAYLSDPAVVEQTSYDVRSIDTVYAFIDGYLADYQTGRSCRWALAYRTDDRLIGTCGFHWWSIAQATAELGYDLAREHWGQGLMTGAVRTVVHWGFKELGLNRVQAVVMVGNCGSARVLEKCGFQLEGTLREYRMCRGTRRDFWMFSLLRREYESV